MCGLSWSTACSSGETGENADLSEGCCVQANSNLMHGHRLLLSLMFTLLLGLCVSIKVKLSGSHLTPQCYSFITYVQVCTVPLLFFLLIMLAFLYSFIYLFIFDGDLITEW